MTILVIGYGNSLQSDDGAGQSVARTVANWQNPLVRTRTTCDLMPTLASEIAQADVVVFVKAMAHKAAVDASLQVHLLSPQQADSAWGHHCTPQILLTLTQRLYGVLPQKSYWFWIPGQEFGFGEQFSVLTRNGVQQALTQLSELVRSHEQKPKSRLMAERSARG
ncbi:MAG: hydrogenase maturation protease [Cyanobacteria bacterium P01_G01_bin.54]